MFLHRLPEQMHAQLANYQAVTAGQLPSATNDIWAQYGGKFPTAAVAKLTVAAATASDNPRGRSPSPRCSSNNSSSHAAEILATMAATNMAAEPADTRLEGLLERGVVLVPQQLG